MPIDPSRIMTQSAFPRGWVFFDLQWANSSQLVSPHLNKTSLSHSCLMFSVDKLSLFHRRSVIVKCKSFGLLLLNEVQRHSKANPAQMHRAHAHRLVIAELFPQSVLSFVRLGP